MLNFFRRQTNAPWALAADPGQPRILDFCLHLFAFSIRKMEGPAETTLFVDRDGATLSVETVRERFLDPARRWAVLPSPDRLGLPSPSAPLAGLTKTPPYSLIEEYAGTLSRWSAYGPATVGKTGSFEEFEKLRDYANLLGSITANDHHFGSLGEKGQAQHARDVEQNRIELAAMEARMGIERAVWLVIEQKELSDQKEQKVLKGQPEQKEQKEEEVLNSQHEQNEQKEEKEQHDGHASNQACLPEIHTRSLTEAHAKFRATLEKVSASPTARALPAYELGRVRDLLTSGPAIGGPLGDLFGPVLSRGFRPEAAESLKAFHYLVEAIDQSRPRWGEPESLDPQLESIWQAGGEAVYWSCREGQR